MGVEFTIYTSIQGGIDRFLKHNGLLDTFSAKFFRFFHCS